MQSADVENLLSVRLSIGLRLTGQCAGRVDACPGQHFKNLHLSARILAFYEGFTGLALNNEGTSVKKLTGSFPCPFRKIVRTKFRAIDGQAWKKHYTFTIKNPLLSLTVNCLARPDQQKSRRDPLRTFESSRLVKLCMVERPDLITA